MSFVVANTCSVLRGQQFEIWNQTVLGSHFHSNLLLSSLGQDIEVVQALVLLAGKKLL